MAIDPRDSNVTYVGVEQGGLLFTSDGGASWQEIDAYYTPEDVVPRHPSGGVATHQSRRNLHQHPDRLLSQSGPRAVRGSIASDRIRGFVVRINWCSRRLTTMWCSCRARAAPRACYRQSRTISRPCRSSAIRVASHLFIGDTGGSVYQSDDQPRTWSKIASGLAPISKGAHYRALQPAAA
jgi:hypothetical protein